MRPNRTAASRHAALLAYDECQGSAVGALVEALDIANLYGARDPAAPQPAFAWRIVSPDGRPPHAMGGVGLAVAGPPEDGPEPDLVFIPGLHFTGDRERFERQIGALADRCGEWLREQQRRGALIAASCAGVFVLAEAGLLDGRKATTSWWLGPMFRVKYPQVEFCEGALVTRDGRVLTSGAFTACLDLGLQVVEYFLGPAIALSCAKVMLIDATRESQFPYMTLQARAQHGDELVLRAQSHLRAHVRDELSVPALAGVLNVSARTLGRRFREALGRTPTQYLQELRVEGAKRLLETTDLSLEEIMERVGYADASAFRRLFERMTKVSPGRYRRMFGLGRR